MNLKHALLFFAMPVVALCAAAGGNSWAATMTVQYSRAGQTTTLSDLQGAFNDIYRGQTDAGVCVGTLIYPQSVLFAAACMSSDFPLSSTGPLDQTADPNPPLNTIEYYDYTIDTGPGATNNVNFLDCSNPGICANRGWCDQGTNPGAPCDDDSVCPGGTCVFVATGCGRNDGAAPLGDGCSAHSVCSNDGKLCLAATECSGGAMCTAPALPPGLCVNTNLSLDPVDAAGCLPNVNDPLYVTRVVPTAAACPD